ncbi:uncharacterized protein TRUGW13939_05060 [Talaromyces rugulosus]|uniref:Aminoglycoside phosphotransferase domain-containing protein n=1 Tax=Talaromyces rugulosus TaxID=121627 RepID=A0A7H8QVA2_TALRU|nr:uncharacterized protein TRUGW13939_05060 [Talaromyces rugulosus]QKX57940.1 hypothetical protein TRUGW13939_05060 [Talaromyces rugulosus]
MEEPLRESIKQVDANTWLIGGLILHRSRGYSNTSTWYDQEEDLSYNVTSATIPLPTTVPLAVDDSRLKLVYDVAERSAVWSLGNSAFCKVKLCVDGTTSEAATLAYVHDKRPNNFEIPRVLYSAESNGRSYLFLSRVPGRTLADAWLTLDEKWKRHYVSAIADVCETLESWKGNTLCGVDGKNAYEPYLLESRAAENYDPQNLLRPCKLMGMDCSKFVFCHADLGPTNVIVEDVPTKGTVGVIDWEIAGFFPRGWIRTKFRISSGLDLPESVGDLSSQQWWRVEVQKLLGTRGFEDYSSEWQAWWY